MNSYAESLKINGVLIRVSVGWDTASGRVAIRVEDLAGEQASNVISESRIAGYKSYSWCAERICDFEDSIQNCEKQLGPDANGYAIARVCAKQIMLNLPPAKDTAF